MNSVLLCWLVIFVRLYILKEQMQLAVGSWALGVEFGLRPTTLASRVKTYDQMAHFSARHIAYMHSIEKQKAPLHKK